MKTLIYLLLPITILLSCTKGTVLPDPGSTVLNVTSQPAWRAEPLNNDYTIQFPMGYAGNGKAGFEGNTFSKYRADKSVSLSYSFCGSTFCNEYGPIIPVGFTGPYSSALTFDGKDLNRTVEIRNGSQLQAVFYFDDNNQAQGVLYLFDPQSKLLRQSLNISYQRTRQSEVLGILQTIRPK